MEAESRRSRPRERQPGKPCGSLLASEGCKEAIAPLLTAQPGQ